MASLLMSENDLTAGRSGDAPGPVLLDETDAGALLARLVRARVSMDADRSTAPQRMVALLAAPPAAQREMVIADARLQTWGACELLVQLSGEAAERDLAEAERLGDLALLVAERLDRAPHLAPLAEDLAARAWAAIGDARRRRGRLLEAEFALRGAASALAHGSGDLVVEATLLEFEAVLRRDQGRGGEAAALLKQAASRYVELHEFHQLARVLNQREQVLAEAPQPPSSGGLEFHG
jgi:hypothetical protein